MHVAYQRPGPRERLPRQLADRPDLSAAHKGTVYPRSARSLPGAVLAERGAREVKTVPGEVVFAYGQRPGDHGNCSAIVFVKWADQPRTISARAIYTFKGQERSQGAAPPFNDTYEWVATYTVPPGHHWIQVGKSWADGPVANTCEGTSAKQRTLIGTVARVELTVELDPKLCTAAKATLAGRSKTVNRLKAQLRKASTKTAKSKLRKKLATAKVSRAKWVKRVGTAC
jgi:hypothetical protein